MDNNILLDEWAPVGIPLSEKMALVSEFVAEDGSWNVNKMDMIPSSIVSKIRGILLPLV